MDINDLRDEIIAQSGANPNNCMRCGKCSATCPSYDEMEYHPHEFVYMVETGDIGPLLKSESLYKCLSCFACVERCPRGVEPANIIETIRNAALREKGGNRMSVEDLVAKLDPDLPQQAIVSAFRKYKK